MRKKHEISDVAQESAQKATIDRVLSTLYANSAMGYFGVKKTDLSKEAITLLDKTIERVSPAKRPEIRDELQYRLDQWKRFDEEPKEKKLEALRLAQKKGITLEQASAHK